MTTKTLVTPSSLHTFPAQEQIVTPSAATGRRPSQLANPSFRRPQYLKPKSMLAPVLETDPTTLHRVMLAQSAETASSVETTNSNFSGFRGNYQLRQVESRESMASHFFVESRYHVSLELSPKEISLLRYMWNRMLGEDSFDDNGPEADKSTLPIPGSLWAQAKQKPLPSIRKANPQFSASSTFCSQLYLNLLMMDPTLETLFPSLRHQAASMAGVLSLAVNSLENLSSLDAYLVNLGKRHARVLGIEPPQFEMMGEAFIQTFHERFGTRFTNELEVLWIKFYMYLANSLLQFGVDPVMKHTGSYAGAEHERYGLVSLAEGLMLSDDVMSSVDSMRRLSLATDISSVNSAVATGKPPFVAGSSRKGSLLSTRSQRKSSVLPLLPPLAHAAHLKKKKTTGRRVKGECTIM